MRWDIFFIKQNKVLELFSYLFGCYSIPSLTGMDFNCMKETRSNSWANTQIKIKRLLLKDLYTTKLYLKTHFIDRIEKQINR